MSHNGANEGFNDEKSSKKKYVKTTPGRISSEPEIRLNKNSNSNYVQVGFQNTLKNIHNTVQDVIEETVEGNKGFNEINNAGPTEIKQNIFSYIETSNVFNGMMAQ